MKIGTVTVHHAHNYGAMLQAYALQKAIIKSGFDCVVIDYDDIKSSLFPSPSGRTVKSYMSWLFYSLKVIFHFNEMKRGFSRFEKFYDLELKKTQQFKCLSDIDVSGIDVLVTGSDQIWNFRRGKNRPYFQLDFGGDIARVSYAASMGSFFSLDETIKENFKRSLDNLSIISVREKETAEYVETISGKRCRIDMDPVFLLNSTEWDAIANKSFKYDLPNKYILCYELLKTNELIECLTRVKREFGLPIVLISPSIRYHRIGDITILDAGPLEMIDLVRNAEIVITNSFHGTVFSIIYHKKFYSVLTSHGPGRITELLTNTGLINQLYSPETCISFCDDFEKADCYIEEQNTASYKYIKSFRKLKEG